MCLHRQSIHWRRALLLLMGVLFALAVAAEEPDYLLVGRDETRFPVTRWKAVQTMTFDDLTVLKDCPVLAGTWEVKNGTLQAVSGEANRAILVGHPKGEAVRVEFDAVNIAGPDGRIGDISVLINTVQQPAYFRTGYALTTGSYYNTCTSFYREGKKLARTEYSPLEDGKTYHVAVELCRGHVRYWLNDRIILETWDQTPQPLDDTRWIGLRTWATHMTIDNLVISEAEAIGKK